MNTYLVTLLMKSLKPGKTVGVSTVVLPLMREKGHEVNLQLGYGLTSVLLCYICH